MQLRWCCPTQLGNIRGRTGIVTTALIRDIVSYALSTWPTLYLALTSLAAATSELDINLAREQAMLLSKRP